MMTPFSKLMVHPIAGSQCSFGMHALSSGVLLTAPVAGSHASIVQSTRSSVILGVWVMFHVTGSHASIVHLSLSLVSTGLFAHVPIAQTSPVQGSRSSQSAGVRHPP